MKVMSLLRRKPQSPGQLKGLAATEYREQHPQPHVPPEYRPEAQGERGEFGRGRNNPPGSVAALMDSARAAGVKPPAQPGSSQGAQRGGGKRTPPRQPAAVRQQGGQQRASEPTPAGVYKMFRDGLSYRDISGNFGIPESAVRVLYEEHRESRRTLAEKIRNVGQAPRLFPWSEVRAAITTAGGSGGGIVGTVATGHLGFLHDQASAMVLEYLGMDDVRVGEAKSYWGMSQPQTGWTVEGGQLVNNAAPTLGTLSVKPLTVFGRLRRHRSTLAHTSESGFMNWLRDSVSDLLHNQLVAALFDGDPADNKIQGFLRKTGFPTVYFGATRSTEASASAVACPCSGPTWA